MRILSWNVNGIRSVHRKGFLNWLKKDKPDILCIQETKAQTDKVSDELKNMKGYFSFWNPAERKGYSGVALLSKEKPLEVKHGLGIKRFDKEGRVLVVKYPKFTLLNLYFPHGRRDKAKLPYKLDMYTAFFSYLNKLKKNVVLCGDFNIAHKEIDLARPKENKNNIMFLPEERKQIDNILSKEFIDTFRHFNKEPGNYTWWPYYRDARKRNLGWRIDYIFVPKNIIKRVKKAFILSDVLGSDHCPIGIEINL